MYSTLLNLVIVFFFVSSQTAVFANSPEEFDLNEAPLIFTCPSSDTIFTTCLPPLPDFLDDFTSQNNEDELWFEAIDGLSDISSSCNTIVIEVQDQTIDPMPIDCSDILITRRTIFIYDGNPNDPIVLPEVCEIIYHSTIPFNLRRLSFPSEFIVSCSEDIPTVYQDFIDNFGFTELDPGCTSIMNDINNPFFVLPPDINYVANPNNPNGCGSEANPGNGFARAQFFKNVS